MRAFRKSAKDPPAVALATGRRSGGGGGGGGASGGARLRAYDRRQLSAELGEPLVGADVARIDRVELFEQCHTVPDRTSFGWVNKRKRLGIAEAE